MTTLYFTYHVKENSKFFVLSGIYHDKLHKKHKEHKLKLNIDFQMSTHWYWLQLSNIKITNIDGLVYTEGICLKDIFNVLGGALGAQHMYESLDIKHLQLDSLGYIHGARLPTVGMPSLAATQHESTLKFFSSNYKDVSKAFKLFVNSYYLWF